jgi:E3 ubiquitin-protein ligase RNF14
MIDCGHVFCVQCLQDFYNNAINEGDLVSVRCLAPDCAKKRAEAQSSKNRKTKTQISPSELLQIPLEHDIVTRYVKLKHKADLESDKNTIYCPRKWCQGAARSKKHKKPQGFEVVDSDDESDAEEKGKNEKFSAEKDLLSVCEDCSFAFCSRCYQ